MVQGYNFYEDTGSGFVKLNAELLPTPNYVRTGLQPETSGSCYFTAVDEAGNESVAGEIATFQTSDVPVLEPWEQILELAIEDGWYGLYNPGQPNTVTMSGSKVASIADALGNMSPIVQATSANQPTMAAGAFGELDGLTFTGVENLATNSAHTINTPLVILAVLRYEGAIDNAVNVWAYDGHNNSSRTGLGTNLSKVFAYGSNNTLGSGQLADVMNLDNNPHIVASEYRPGENGQIWLDGVMVGYRDTKTNGPVPLLRVGSDFASARKWRGEEGIILVAQGDADQAKIKRMMNLISQFSEIPQPAQPISCVAYGTFKMSDGSPVQMFNENAVLDVASITKLMNVLVATDYITDYNVTGTVVPADNFTPVPTSIQIGDTATYDVMIASALIQSDNVAANALGRSVAQMVNPTMTNNQAEAWYLQKMNQKAVELGMANTTYTHLHHYGQSTVADTAKLIRHIQLNSPKIKQYWSDLTYQIVVTGGNARSYAIETTVRPPNAHRLLPEVVGGKDGFIPPLTNMGVVWLNPDDSELYITVTLNSTSGNKFGDVRRVIDLTLNP